jgi:Uncharacterized lipoprotein
MAILLRAVGLVLLTSALSLGGCAFSDLNVSPPAGPIRASMKGGKGRAVRVMVPFADQRPERHRCGMQKNGFNMDTANVHCTEDPASSLPRLLAGSLGSAGFSVYWGPEGSSTVTIAGQLLQYFVEPKVGFVTFTPEADIYVRLTATSGSGLVAERNFYIKADETSMVGTESNFQRASDAATQRLIAEMTGAIAALMDRYPELGTPVGPRS